MRGAFGGGRWRGCRLGEGRTFLAYFDHHLVVVDEASEVVLFHDVCRNVFHGNPHVLVFLHLSAEVEVLDIYRHVSSARSGEDAVEMEFDGRRIGGWSGNFAVVDDLVAADGESDAVHVDFVGLEGGDNTKVSGNAIVGFVGVLDEVDGV